MMASVRAFATKSGSKKSAAAAPPPPPPEPEPVDPVKQLPALRKELASLVDKDLERVIKPPGEEHPYAKYVSEHKLDIALDAKQEQVTIKKSILGYDLKVQFTQSPDPEDNEANEENEQEDAEGEEEKKSKDEFDGFNYSFLVDVKPTGTSGPTMRVFAVSSKDSKCYFEGLTLADTDAQLTDYPAIDYNDLSVEAQDKLADFMDMLKVDDELAQFIPAAAAETHREGHITQLSKLKKFLEILPASK